VEVNRRIPRLLAVGYALLLALVSLLPSNQLPIIPDWSRLFSPDKGAHFGAYALFALLLSVCFSERGKITTTVKAVFLAGIYGASLEVLQALAGTGRSFDPVDMVANCLGALFGGTIITLFYQLKK
jgi:VanZ family protein